MPARAIGRRENRAELATTFGVTVVTIDAWVRAGCPVDARPNRGSGWVFNTAAVAKWRETHVVQAALGKLDRVETDEAKRRKAAADAELAEMAVSERRAALAPVAEMRRFVEGRNAVVRERLLAIPGKIANDPSPERVETEIHEALEELSTFDDDSV